MLITSIVTEREVAARIPAGKSIEKPVELFFAVSKEKLKPGKYKCRLKLRYQEKTTLFEAVSGQIEVEITKDDLEKR
jgi:hypothetical protein